MAITYTTRRGKTYYLHTSPERGGGIQLYVSTDPEGPLAGSVPEGFEIYETPSGQVYLRKKKPDLIKPAELALVEKELQEQQTSEHCYLAEVSGGRLTLRFLKHLGTDSLYDLYRIRLREFNSHERRDQPKRCSGSRDLHRRRLRAEPRSRRLRSCPFASQKESGSQRRVSVDHEQPERLIEQPPSLF
jgi:hypothetical protein